MNERNPMKSLKRVVIQIFVSILGIFILSVIVNTSVDAHILKKNQRMIHNYDMITQTVVLYDASKNAFRLYNRNRASEFYQEYQQTYTVLMEAIEGLSQEFEKDIQVKMHYRIIRQMLKERHQLIEAYSTYETVGQSLSQDLEFVQIMSDRISTQLNYLLASYLSYINQGNHEQTHWYATYKRTFNLIMLIMISGIIIGGLVTITKVKEKLHQTKQAMTDIGERRFSTPDITLTQYDDINVYINTANTMKHEIIAGIEQIEAFAEQKIIHEKQGRLLAESQFKALQLQINPHFLFNTLSLVIRHIQLNEKEVSIQLVKETSRILRNSLGKLDQLITLDEEIELLEAYIYIQRLHLQNRVDIVLDIRKSYGGSQIMVPSLVIQPLVENAVLHGMKETSEQGLIEIKILEKATHIDVVVSDNGVGMCEQQVQQLFNVHQEEHIGMTNVLKRLQLIYDHKNSDLINIWSEPGEGTTITMKLYKEVEL